MAMQNRKEIWVFAETCDGVPVPVYQELLGKASELADAMDDAAVCGVILGENCDSAIASAAAMGTSRIYTVEHEKLAARHYESDVYALEHLARTHQPELILVGATALGAELAPTLAARLKTGLAAHCVDLRLGNGRVNCMVPAFGGRVISEIYIPQARPMLASVRPGIFSARELPAVPEPEIIREDSAFLDDFVPREEFVSFFPHVATGKKLEEADTVVCAGRGVSEGPVWERLNQLADCLDASVGYTRSFADLELVPDESNMIGTSGKSVRPKVYIGFGISGATHHVCGMNKSKLVISVNRDPKAKMFQYSDYGAVSDADKILTALLAELKK